MKLTLPKRLATSLLTVVAVAATLFVTTPAIAADESATLQLEIGAVGLTTQSTGMPFSTLLSISCAGDTGASCDNAVITVPWPADPDPALGGSRISTWGATAVSNVPGLLSGSVAKDSANRQWIITLRQPIPADGSSTGIQLDFTPPNYTTPNGLEFPVQPTITGDTFAAVTAATPILFTTKASTVPTITKTMPTSTPVAGANVQWKIDWYTGGSSNPGTLGTLPGTRKIVDVLPPEVEFVSVSPATALYDYDEATHTVTFSTEDLPVPAGVSTISYYINAKVKPGVAEGSMITNTASLHYQFVGQSEAGHVESTVSKDVAGELVLGNLFNKTFYSSNLPAGAANSALGLIATAAETDGEARYTLSVKQDGNPISWEIVDPVPCLPAGTTTVSSGAVGSLCADPAFHITKIYTQLDPTATTLGQDTGKTVTFTYTDGTEDTLPLLRQRDVYPKAGGVVSRMTISGSHESGSSSSNYWVYGTLDASLQDQTAVTRLRNTAYARASVQGTPLPADYGSKSADATIVREVRAAQVANAANVAVKTGGPSVNMSPTTNLLSSSTEFMKKGRTVVVMPDAPFTSTGPGFTSSENDWMGTGRTSYSADKPILSGSSISVSAATVPAGAYPYDVYTGFSGEVLGECSREQGGTPATGNDYFIDTTGIIGPVGVPTSVCHRSGYIVVSGPVPDSSTTKSVKGEGDTSWLTSPGTSTVSGDGTGAVDFKINWANTGSAALQDVTIYDMLPTAGDTFDVGNRNPRGSTFRPTLKSVTAPSGWTVAYSTAANPCRPEIISVNPGCDPAWATTAPTAMSNVTALKFTKASSSAVGLAVDFLVSMNAGAFNTASDVAWNTASTRAYVAGSTPLALAITETPRVGFGLVAEPGISVVKEVCTTANCAETAAEGEGGWAKNTNVAYDASAKWRITVTNTGETDLTDVEIVDPLVTACALEVGDLAVGAHATKVCTSTGLRASLTNEATATGTGNGVAVSDSDTAAVTVSAAPTSGVALIKQLCVGSDEDCDEDAAENAPEWSTTATVPYEGTVNWRVIVKNTGATTLTDVTVTDLANLGCAFTVASLAPAAYQVETCANTGLTSNMTNTAGVTAKPPFGGSTLSDTATATVTVADPVPAISLTKEVCDADACDADAKPGEGGWGDSTSVPYFGSAKWRLIVTNTGQNQLESVLLKDPLESKCELHSNQWHDQGFIASVLCESKNLTESFTNTATVTAVDPKGTEVTATDAAEVEVGPKPLSDIELTYESCDPAAGACDPDSPIGEGGWSLSTTVPFEGNGKWRATVKNTGSTTLTDVTVTNPDYPGCAFTIASLAAGAGESRVCSVEKVDGTLTGNATVTAKPPYGDPDLSKEASAEILSAEPLAKIDAQKEVCSTGNDCDPNAEPLTGGWVKAATLEPGTEPQWRIIVTNNGQVKLVDVQVSDPNLPGCTSSFDELAVGERQIISCKGPAVFGSAGGKVVVTGTNPRTGGTETVTSESEAQAIVREFASAVSLKKEACVVAHDSDCLEAGTGWKAHATGDFASEMWWRITVTNSGNTDLTSVAVTDPQFPAGDFTVELLKAGESKSIVFSAGAWKVTDAKSPRAKNTASVTAKGVQGEELTASASALGTVEREPIAVCQGCEIEHNTKKPAELSTTGGSDLMGPVIGAVALLLAGAFVMSRRRAH